MSPSANRDDSPAGGFCFSPVGVVRADQCYRFEAPRQGIYGGGEAQIEFMRGCNYEQALADLAGFERIWVIFVFDRNLDAGYRVKCDPPVSPGRKVGVFATRSPYRPNPIGISCVELLRVTGRVLHIANSDLLDGTPVLDVKPYIPAADAFPQASTGWLAAAMADCYELAFAPKFMDRAEWIYEHCKLNLIHFCKVQLALAPLDSRRKRLHHENGGQLHWIGCRTWQLGFAVDEGARKVILRELRSNYSKQDLLPGAVDLYGDKEMHRAFRAVFSD
ncbi:MAG: tRNA (N6-threonylcarbamoyladenosine(37)-N6)-methyltransferase TrmO [Victivallaceae bacterium]|nr:tRNA (N6-threonylcarbamoyladenosine(37)-N6)-methyltransferase TrmO [Victivallaceae bacterium]